MNKFLTGTIAAIAVAVAVPALAADMAPRYSKAPPPAPVIVYNWTGVDFLRRGWINVDLIWVAVLATCGVILLVA